MAANELKERTGKRVGYDLPRARTFSPWVEAKGAETGPQTGFFVLFAFSRGYFNCGS